MCDCIKDMNEKLREHNAVIVRNLLGAPRACIVVMKRDEKKRGKLPYLMATFCPFCGEKYTDTPALAFEAEGASTENAR